MTFETSLILIGALVLFVLKPGPNMVATISRSISDGFSAGIAMTLGVTAGQVVFFLVAVFGYSLIEAYMSFLVFFLKSAGAAYLIYIGIKGLLHLEAGTWGGKPDQTTKITNLENFMSSFAICMSNPFTILFYAAFIPQIIPLGNISVENIILSLVVIVMTYLVMHGSMAYAASSVKNTLKNETLVRRINFAVSAIFIMLGLFFIASIFPIFNFSL
ncbi:MAG: LysE family translocator [Pseudomonadota bacterium]